MTHRRSKSTIAAPALRAWISGLLAIGLLSRPGYTQEAGAIATAFERVLQAAKGGFTVLQGAPNPDDQSSESYVSKIRLPRMDRCIVTPNDAFSCVARFQGEGEAMAVYKLCVDGIKLAAKDQWDSTEYTGRGNPIKSTTFLPAGQSDSASTITVRARAMKQGYFLVQVHYFLRPQ